MYYKDYPDERASIERSGYLTKTLRYDVAHSLRRRGYRVGCGAQVARELLRSRDCRTAKGPRRARFLTERLSRMLSRALSTA